MQASASQASSSSSSQSSPDHEPSYERWSDNKEKMLINLWAENFDHINSSQARKAWDDITKQINLKSGTDNYLPLVRPSVSVEKFSFPVAVSNFCVFLADKDENFFQARPIPKRQIRAIMGNKSNGTLGSQI